MPDTKKRILVLAGACAGMVAVVALVALKRPLMEQWYIWRLDSSNAEARNTAIEQLAAYGSDRAIPKLIELFREDSGSPPETQIDLSRVGVALARIGPDAIPAVFEVAKTAEDLSVKIYAPRILQRMGTTAVPFLTQRLKDSDSVARRISAEILGQVGIMHPELEAGELVRHLVSLLNDQDEIVRARTAYALGMFGVRAAIAGPHLATALADDSVSVRKNAAYALGRIPATRVTISALSRALDDEHEGVRNYAAYALGLIGLAAKDAIAALSRAVRDSDAMVRAGATSALSAIESGSEIPALLQALQDKDPAVVHHATHALAQAYPGAEALPTLIAILASEFVHSRRAAAEVLGSMRVAARGATDALKRAAQDDDEGVRDAASLALARIEGILQ